jgi:hypothetical protein
MDRVLYPARAANGVFPVGDDYDVAALHNLVKLHPKR